MSQTPRNPNDDASNTHWRLLGDIGGTNARFALAGADGRIEAAETLRCADYDGPAEAARDYLTRQRVDRIEAAALAVATAVDDDTIAFTNRAAWRFSIDALRRALGVERLAVINDFTALALSIPRLDPAAIHPVTGHGQARPDAVKALIGPGTGLGVSGIVPAGRRWLALDSEGGHVSLAPADAHEIRLLDILQRRFGHVSTERVLSGPGLVNLHEAHCTLDGVEATPLAPSEITARGLGGDDPRCAAVLADFCALLGNAAGNLVLTLGALGGLYIGGGIVPRLRPMLAESRFRERFEAHGRLSRYLERVPCYVLDAPYPALVGALAALEDNL